MNPIKPLPYTSSIVLESNTAVSYLPSSDRFEIRSRHGGKKEMINRAAICKFLKLKLEEDIESGEVVDFLETTDKISKANGGAYRVDYTKEQAEELMHRKLNIRLFSPLTKETSVFDTLFEMQSFTKATRATVIRKYRLCSNITRVDGKLWKMVIFEEGEFIYPAHEKIRCTHGHVFAPVKEKDTYRTSLFQTGNEGGLARTHKDDFITDFNARAAKYNLLPIRESDFIDLSDGSGKDDKSETSSFIATSSISNEPAVEKVGVVKGANRWLPHDAARWMYESEEHMKQGVWVNDFDEYSGWRLVKDPREIYGKHIVVNDGLADATKRSITPIFQEIHIHYDFSTGKEKSLIEVKMCDDPIVYTHCTAFFNTDEKARVVVKRLDGSYIDRDELMSNNGAYTVKNMRPAHNLEKMLRAGALDFKKP